MNSLITDVKIPLAHAITDKDGRFLNVDDAFCTLMRRERNDILKSTIIDLTVERDRPSNNEKLNLLLKTGRSFLIRKAYLCGDGTTHAVENSVSLLIDRAGGELVGATVRSLEQHSLNFVQARLQMVRLLLKDQMCRSGIDPALRCDDWRLVLGAYLLEAEGGAVWAIDLANYIGGDVASNLLRIWELVSASILTVDGCAGSLQQASVRVAASYVRKFEAHIDELCSI